MQCSTCRHDAVIFQPYSGQHLCKDHFIASVESRAKREIRKHQGFMPGDHLGVLQDGALPGETLFFFLKELTRERKDIRVSSVRAGTADPSITKIAVAATLDEASAAVLAAVLRGYQEQPLMTGLAAACRKPLPQIAPFSHIPGVEIALYGRLQGIAVEEGTAISQEPDPFLNEVKSLLAEYTEKHPAAPHAVLNLGGALDLHCKKPGVNRHGA